MKNIKKVAIIGMGYVGLPLMISMVKKDIDVLGFDILEERVQMLNSGKNYIKSVSDEDVKMLSKKLDYVATMNNKLLSQRDIIVITVPTPLTKNNDPDLHYVESSIHNIAKNITNKKPLIILESTTYPGTMSDIVLPILESYNLKNNHDFYLAYSPEREDPGNSSYKNDAIPKIVSADNQDVLEITTKFYSKFIKSVYPVKSIKVAESAKLLENIFRSVNIALINEMKKIMDKMDIDIWEVIEAAKTKPFGFMPFYPGPGIGGHCIPIDPFYMTWKAKEFGIHTRLIELSGEINNSMPYYIVQKTVDILNKVSYKAINGANILILGVAYKADINDFRESPALDIITQLRHQGADVSYYDPLVPSIDETYHYNIQKSSVALDNLGQYDAVLIITDHSDIDYQHIVDNAKVIIDTRNIIARNGIKNNNVFKC